MRTLHQYQSHLITEPGKVPTVPHFAVLVFDTFSYESSGYDAGDPSYTNRMTTTAYYAFLDYETWEKMIREFTQERITKGTAEGAGARLVYFHSGGAAQVKISIGIESTFQGSGVR